MVSVDVKHHVYLQSRTLSTAVHGVCMVLPVGRLMHFLALEMKFFSPFFFVVAENDNGALAGVELESFSNVIRKHTLLTEVVLFV